MQVSVEVSEGLERKIVISIPAEKVDAEVNKQVAQQARTVRLDGFRPGKAPVSVVQKRFGASIRRDAVLEQMQRHYFEAITQEKINPTDMPRFDILVDEAGKDLEFTATIEVFPEIELQGLDSIAVKKPVVDITDDDLSNMLETLRKQHATWKEVEREAKDGDQTTIDFLGRVDGEAFEGGEAKDFPIELGSGRMIPGFEDGILGMKQGESKTIQVTFPEEYHAENLKGKEAEFDITVSKVETQELPELNDEFVALFGIEKGGVDALQTEVKKNMQRELNNTVKSQVKTQVLDGLIEANNDILVPKALVSQEVDVLRQQTLQRFGGGQGNMPELPAELFEEQATRRAKTGLLLGEVIRQHEIKVDDTRVHAIIEELATAYDDPQQVVEHYQNNAELMQQVRNLALEDQAVDFILEQAKVEEENKVFDEIMNRPA